MDIINQGLPLGRWFGIRVVLHFYFLLYLLFRMFNADDKTWAAVWLTILFGSVLLHEFGHALACRAVKGQADQILLWPLGGLAFCNPPPRPWPGLVTTVCGPLVNVLLVPIFVLARHLAAPHLDDSLWSLYADNALRVGMQINASLFVFNILPIFPMDGGRIVQELLWFVVGYAKSLMIAAMIGTVGGIGLIVLGTGVIQLTLPLPDWLMTLTGGRPYTIGGAPSMILVAIGLMAAMTSFQTYRRAQELVR